MFERRLRYQRAARRRCAILSRARRATRSRQRCWHRRRASRPPHPRPRRRQALDRRPRRPRALQRPRAHGCVGVQVVKACRASAGYWWFRTILGRRWGSPAGLSRSGRGHPGGTGPRLPAAGLTRSARRQVRFVPVTTTRCWPQADMASGHGKEDAARADCWAIAGGVVEELSRSRICRRSSGRQWTVDLGSEERHLRAPGLRRSAHREGRARQPAMCYQPFTKEAGPAATPPGKAIARQAGGEGHRDAM